MAGLSPRTGDGDGREEAVDKAVVSSEKLVGELSSTSVSAQLALALMGCNLHGKALGARPTTYFHFSLPPPRLTFMQKALYVSSLPASSSPSQPAQRGSVWSASRASRHDRSPLRIVSTSSDWNAASPLSLCTRPPCKADTCKRQQTPPVAVERG